MTLTAKIRFSAAMRVRVKITKKRRSKTGYWVWFPDGEQGQSCAWAKGMPEARAMLLAKVRTASTLFFAIEPAPKEVVK